VCQAATDQGVSVVVGLPWPGCLPWPGWVVGLPVRCVFVAVGTDDADPDHAGEVGGRSGDRLARGANAVLRLGSVVAGAAVDDAPDTAGSAAAACCPEPCADPFVLVPGSGATIRAYPAVMMVPRTIAPAPAIIAAFDLSSGDVDRRARCSPGDLGWRPWASPLHLASRCAFGTVNSADSNTSSVASSLVWLSGSPSNPSSRPLTRFHLRTSSPMANIRQLRIQVHVHRR
jgi:hypothetical protein